MTLYDLAIGNDGYIAKRNTSSLEEINTLILNTCDKELISKLQAKREVLFEQEERRTSLYNMTE